MKVPRLSAGAKATDAWNAANHELPVAAKSARAPPLVAEVTHRSRVWGELPASRAPGAKATCELRAVRTPSAGAEVARRSLPNESERKAIRRGKVARVLPVGAQVAESRKLRSEAAVHFGLRAGAGNQPMASRSVRTARQCLSCAFPLRGSVPLRRGA